ncbi:MAG: ABC transporter ATP-binding protein [Actinomycetota bacterium]|nr:ABC transporter ATP-binding protein [Actinomycetota bacterium]
MTVVEAEPGPRPPVPPARVAAVELVAVTKVYGELRAVDGLDLVVAQGSVFGLIGPNGAGKTTTFSIIASLLRPTSGRVRVMGIDPVADPRAVRAVMGYMPDVLGLYDDLTVGEYLRFFAHAYRLPVATWTPTVAALLELVDLTAKRDAQVNSLSRGMKQRLSLARALVHDPTLLVLDEPASGLDPRARVELRELLHQLAAMGKTIVVSSHILAELAELCTEVGIMERGRLLASGEPRTLLERLGGGRAVSVRFADGTTETHTVDDADAQVALLAKLVAEGRPVLEFSQTGAGLEDLFLRVTKGEVQ